MKTSLFYLTTLCFTCFTSLVFAQHFSMFNGVYLDNEHCSFLSEKDDLFITGKIYLKTEIAELNENKEYDGFMQPIGIDTTKIVAYKIHYLSDYFDDIKPKQPSSVSSTNNSSTNILRNEVVYGQYQRNGISYRNTRIIALDSTNRPIYSSNTRPNEQYHSSRNRVRHYNNVEPSISRQTLLATLVSNGNYYVFNREINTVLTIDSNGENLSFAKIKITQPVVFSPKSKEILIDEKTEDLYMIISTNFVNNVYKLNPENGETEFLIKIEGVWDSPKWNIKNKLLTYVKHEELLSLPLD